MRKPLIICVLLALLVGCNADPRSRREMALLRSEILDLEDQYYGLKSDYEDTVSELAACKGVPIETLLREQSGVVGSGVIVDLSPENVVFDDDCVGCETIISEGVPSLDTAPGMQPGNRSILEPPQNPTITAPDDGEMPEADELDLPGQTQQSQPQTMFNAKASRPVKNGRQLTGDSITEIYINPKFTVAQNVDGKIGDDGLVLLLQPRAANGKPVLRPGTVTVSIIEPSAPEHRREIGKWTFAPTELDLFKNNPASNRAGYQLHLPWDLNTPTAKRLIIAVRYVAPDGRILESSKAIRLTPPGEDYDPDAPLIAAWTEDLPNADQWSDVDIALDLPGEEQPVRQGVRAIPAKAKTRSRKKAWRPVR